MARAEFKLIQFPRTFTFDLVLDEMPIYRCAGFRGGEISGNVEITYDTYTADWHVSHIAIVTDNARCGQHAETRLVSITKDDEPTLHALLIDRIRDDYESNIRETIAMELAEAA